MILIKNATVHIGDGTVHEHWDILSDQCSIVQMGENLSSDEAQVIDASGCHVFPGFIDPVSTLGAMGLPGRNADNSEHCEPVTPEMNIKYSIDPDEINQQEFYRSGITTIGLSPSHRNLMGGQIAVCKTAAMKMSQRLVKEGAALKCSVSSAVKVTFGGKSRLPMTKMGIFHLFNETLRSARSCEKEKRNERQQTICSVFDECSMPVFVAAESKMEIDGLLYFLKDENVSINLVDAFCFADSLDGILERKVGVILGNVNHSSQIAKHGIELDKLCKLMENGNKLALTTTCGGRSEGRETLIWSAVEVYRAGMEAEDVVKMLCLYPAQMLGVDHRIGTLAVGKDADFSVFSGNPITSYAAKVMYSIINGEVVFSHE